MRIRKQYQVIPTNALLENGHSTSATNGYVAEYINEHSVVVSPTEPSGSARKKVWKQHSKNIAKITLGNSTLYGITFTKNSDGSITLNGTSTGGSIILNDYINVKDYGYGNFNYSLEIISGSFTGTCTTAWRIGTTGSSYVINQALGTGVNENLNIQQETSSVQIYGGNGTVFNNLKLRLQITKSNEKLDFEPAIDDKEYILNNNVYEEFNPNKEEVIDITSLSGGATINSTYWRNRLVKQGKICHLELAFAPNSTSNITIYQLPAGFYSSGNTATIGLLMRNSLLGKMVITNGGVVQVQVGSESGNTWSLNATWVVD